MPQSLYDDTPETAEPAQDGGDKGGMDNEGKTAILPKSCCPECKPGDTISVKVVRVNENDVEVQCEGDEDHEEEQAPESTPDEGSGPMRSMLED